MEKYLPAYLQSRGVTVHRSCNRRKGGAGPAEGITIVVNERPISVPTTGSTIDGSPYSIHHIDGKHYIFNNGSLIKQVTLPPSPRYYSLKTAQGIEYRKIGLLHGSSCLASTVLQQCTYWHSSQRCAFCGIELSLQSHATIVKKTPQELVEVAKAAFQLDGISHITLTTGTQADSSFELEYLASCSAYLKAETNLPIHVQCMPPPNLSSLELLKQSGVDTIGVHIESFDQKILKKMAPCKASIDLRYYITVWRECVRLFGFNQVSSFIIAGLGEKNRSTFDGAALLCELGVYPFIVPLRPIPGTLLEGQPPPDSDQTIALYQEVALRLKASGLSWKNSKAGCVRCGACSGLPHFEHG
jgi:radical SAM protein (TIGR04043 family)